MEKIKEQAEEKPETIKLESPIHKVISPTFQKLSHEEQVYAYHLHNAVWLGFLTHYFTKSYESPALFALLIKIFK